MQFIAPDCKIGPRLFARRRGNVSPDLVFQRGCRRTPSQEKAGAGPTWGQCPMRA